MATRDSPARATPSGMSPEDTEFWGWLVDIERRAILPLKWALLFSSIFIWQYTRGVTWPEVDVFLVFFVYALSILAMHYFFVFSKIPPSQVPAFCWVSYGIDLLFVTALIYLDHRHARAPDLMGAPDFYILYFLLLIRGFVLYRTAFEAVVVNVLISLLFVFSVWLNEPTLDFFFQRAFLVKLFLVWMVILLAWFIFEIVNRQKFELLRARERLHQSQRLSALGELAAGVAHEINNPIGIISAYADLLIRQSESDDSRREDYEVIQSEAQRCKRIVGELLSFARPSESQREPTDLCALNDEVLRFIFHNRADSTIALKKTYATDVPQVLVDPVQVKQALLNVYVNAQQALGVEGGRIDVTVAPVGREAVQVTISDDGPGIAADDLARVFDPFFTRKPGGSGLGLAITRRLVEANAGEIEIQPRRPRGVVVTITFREIAAPAAILATVAK